MARSTMKEKNIPDEFWAEVVNIVVYLQNGSYTILVSTKTPFEAFTGKKSRYQAFEGARVHLLCSCSSLSKTKMG